MKICLNPLCGKEFEPKNPKGKYCSPNCKSAHQYQVKTALKESGLSPTIPMAQKKKIEILKSLDPTLKAASEIVPPALPEWARHIENYCNKNGCTHTDLIEAHANRNKKPVAKKEVAKSEKKESEKGSPGESYLERRNRMKNRTPGS